MLSLRNQYLLPTVMTSMVEASSGHEMKAKSNVVVVIRGSRSLQEGIEENSDVFHISMPRIFPSNFIFITLMVNMNAGLCAIIGLCVRESSPESTFIVVDLALIHGIDFIVRMGGGRNIHGMSSALSVEFTTTFYNYDRYSLGVSLKCPAVVTLTRLSIINSHVGWV